MSSMTVAQLSDALASPTPPLVIDVRRREAFLKDTKTIGGALRRDPERVDAWAGELPSADKIVVSCVHGHEVSQGVARALRPEAAMPTFWTGASPIGRLPAAHVIQSRKVQAPAGSRVNGPRSTALPARG